MILKLQILRILKNIYKKHEMIIINDIERLLNIDILLTVMGIRVLHDGDNTILIIILLYFIEYWYSGKSLLVFYLWCT